MLKKIDPALLGSTIATIVRVWGKLLRYEQKQYAVINQIRKKRPLIYALWHDELFAPCYFHRQEGIIAVVSSSRDGEILSQVMLKLGYNLARGSSNRGGLRALREALKKMQSLQKDVVFTIDGPQGPRHSVKEGIIYLAQKTQSPIVPL